MEKHRPGLCFPPTAPASDGVRCLLTSNRVTRDGLARAPEKTLCVLARFFACCARRARRPSPNCSSRTGSLLFQGEVESWWRETRYLVGWSRLLIPVANQ